MPLLSTGLRRSLERLVVAARDTAENAVFEALTILAVDRETAPSTILPDQRQLRTAMRAYQRRLGGGAPGFNLLVEEAGYVQWHRMLFARFLAENDLLIHPQHRVAVSLDECAELAPEEGEPDAWALAARYAAAMLPGIFRPDDPLSQLRLSPEGRRDLEAILAEIPTPVFTADDALGWVYQFWQSRRKNEVNRSERKIGGADLAPVTQLFTEHYMVRFLLDNSLGAWWASRHPNSLIIQEWVYLRRRDDDTPATGDFSGWPGRAAEVTVMDPCCGSGHFLVEAFEMLRRMRAEEEGLSPALAADAVLRDNIFGLELDPRCTQIAAFALAFAAWRATGYRPLPTLNIACSGLAVTGSLESWTKLAGEDKRLSSALERLHKLFRNAPELGSLINPTNLPANERMFSADYTEVEPLLTKALRREKGEDPAAAVFGAAAEGVARAARLLAGKYTLVTANPPYLGIKKQSDILKEHIETSYPDERMDIATAFIARCRQFSISNGSYVMVTPQNWLFLMAYKKFRQIQLENQTWVHICRLGSGAFETIGGEVVNVILAMFINNQPTEERSFWAIDVSSNRTPEEKSRSLMSSYMTTFSQRSQLKNPDSRITFLQLSSEFLLQEYVVASSGMLTGDSYRFYRQFWEVPHLGHDWEFLQSTVSETMSYGGMSQVVYWQQAKGELFKLAESLKNRNNAVQNWRRGQEVRGQRGVAISSMGKLPCSLYNGDFFDNNTTVIVPKLSNHLPAIWAFCQSGDVQRSLQ
jgi:hypothetical protein